LNDPLIYVRALHFAATITAAGVVWFIAFIAEPAFRHAKQDTGVALAFRNHLAWVAWIGLLGAILSGVPWLILTAESMSGQPLDQLASQGVLWTVLSQTDFGRDWLLRFIVACVLGGLCVHFLSAEGMKSLWVKAVTVILAAALVGSLAWAGHAIGGRGVEGLLHPAADVLHLIAAAAWTGAAHPPCSTAGDDGSGCSLARGGANDPRRCRFPTHPWRKWYGRRNDRPRPCRHGECDNPSLERRS
jgi:putative copper resistance protein D